uniref:ropporin-1-like protein n=1 Tax=Oncorhynchus gorbuscha TaxID=8017 RepID=UPI001EAF19A4|nr:ropporin-1-like protein [Oncorhynchus gorbuscha]
MTKVPNTVPAQHNNRLQPIALVCFRGKWSLASPSVPINIKAKKTTVVSLFISGFSCGTYKTRYRTTKRTGLLWYFSALSKGDILPTKERLERPVDTQKTDTGLTPGLLKVLNKQIPIPTETISMEELQQKWKGLCQPSEQLDTAALGNFFANIHWMQLFALNCGVIINALRYACEILTEYEGGGAATMPFDLFSGLYTLPGPPGRRDPQDQIDSFLSSLQKPV